MFCKFFTEKNGQRMSTKLFSALCISGGMLAENVLILANKNGYDFTPTLDMPLQDYVNIHSLDYRATCSGMPIL